MNTHDVAELKSDVKEIRKDVNDIAVTMARNTMSLEAHMARTEASEDRLDRVENWLVGLLISILLAFVYYLLRR